MGRSAVWNEIHTHRSGGSMITWILTYTSTWPMRSPKTHTSCSGALWSGVGPLT